MEPVDLTVPDIPDEAYPPFAVTEAERERWRVAHAVAEAISRQNEPSGTPNSTFVWYFARSVYHSDVPTGTADDPVPELAEGGAEAVTQFHAALEEAQLETLLDGLEKSKPGPQAEEKAHWDHVGRVCDVLDKLFGTPDEIDGLLGDSVGKLHLGDEPDELFEAFEHVLPGKYDAKMHPRDRAGRWSQTLHAIKAFAAKHPAAVKQHFARRAAQNDPGAARLRARAATARAGKMARGAKQAAINTHHRSVVGAVNTLAMVYSEKTERKLGAVHENLKDPLTTLDTFDRAAMTKDLVHEAAQWAVEHHEELSTVLQVAKHAAGAVGLAAADDEGSLDGPELEEADALLVGLLA